jgi:hypothetical protein
MPQSNLTFINSTDRQDISDELASSGADAFHATNGTYAYKAEMIVPTMLAGFQYVGDKIAKENDALLIAVNSDASMRGIYAKQNKSQADFDALESQQDRALKVAGPLAEQNPGKKVFVVFYDDETPTGLYTKLAGDGLNLKTLHKWGYGTQDPSGKPMPRIEGADNFGMVLGFPLVNDVKPVCTDITVMQDQKGVVKVVKLHEENGPHGAPYISPQGKVLFPVPHSLASHHQDSLTPVAPSGQGGGKPSAPGS